MANIFSWLWDILSPILEGMIQNIQLLASIWIGSFKGIMTGLGPLINGIASVLGGLIDFIMEYLLVIGQKPGRAL